MRFLGYTLHLIKELHFHPLETGTDKFAEDFIKENYVTCPENRAVKRDAQVFDDSSISTLQSFICEAGMAHSSVGSPQWEAL